jgi:hypothetical protein
MDGEGDDRHKAGRVDRFEGEQGLPAPRERLGDHEVDSRLGRPADLLLEHTLRRGHRGRVTGGEDVGVADITGEQRPALGGDILGDAQSLAVDHLQVRLPTDQAQLLPVGVVGEGLDDIGAGVNELTM